MTTEGLENLKKVMRKAIELQTDTVIVMSALQRIYYDEEDDLDSDSKEHLLCVNTSARSMLDCAFATTNNVRRAYGVEKDNLDKQDNDEARIE